MAIVIGTDQINAKFLGGLALNKIMLGVIEIFPNIGGTPAFSPSDWFVNGEKGLFYNFNELGAGNLVLGAEMNPQPDFNSAAGWTVGSNMNVSGGALNAQNTWASGQSSHALVLARGKTYYVEAVVENFVGTGQFSINMGNNPSADGSLVITGNGTFKAVLRNDTASAPERLQVGNLSAAGYSFSITRLSCREIVSGYVPTQFQLSTGAFPVGAQRQPIGLTLDLKNGLPVELVPDPGFNDPSKWFVNVGTGWVVTGGQATFPVAGANAHLSTVIPEMVAGKTYKLSFTVVSGSGLNYTAQVGGTQSTFPWLSGLGMQSAIVVAGSANNYVSIRNANGAVMVVDNISLVEIEPTRALQATAAARPQFNTVGNAMGAIFDGVDDGLLSAVIDFTTTPIITVMAVVLRNTNTRGMAYEFTANPANGQAGSFGARIPENSAQQWRFEMGNQGVSQFKYSTTTYATPQLAVATCVYDGTFGTATDRLNFTLNDLIVPSNPGGAPGSPQAGFANDILYLGRRGNVNTPANISIGAIVVIDRELTAAEQTEGVNYFKSIFGDMVP